MREVRAAGQYHSMESMLEKIDLVNPAFLRKGEAGSVDANGYKHSDSVCIGSSRAKEGPESATSNLVCNGSSSANIKFNHEIGNTVSIGSPHEETVKRDMTLVCTVCKRVNTFLYQESGVRFSSSLFDVNDPCILTCVCSLCQIKKHQVAVEDPSRDCGLDFDSLQQKVRPFTNGLACMGPPDAHLGAGMGTHALPTLEGVGEGEQAKGQMPQPCQYVPPAPRRAGLGERSRDSVLRLRQYGEGAAPRPNEKRKPDLPRPLPGDSVGGGAITPRLR